jgi:hypothetical protein
MAVLATSHEYGAIESALEPQLNADCVVRSFRFRHLLHLNAARDAWFAGSAIVNGQRLGPPLGIRSVAANSNGIILFANVDVGGIPRSVDGGRTWQPTIDINSDFHEVRAHHADPDIIVAASAIGLCISRDAGATWHRTRRPTRIVLLCGSVLGR